jgi:L-malate glycosyltransferase
LARPIRVCYLIDRLLPAGTESQLLALIRHLDRRRVTPYLCLLDGEDDLSRSLEPDCCPVLRLGVRSLHHPRTLLKAWQFARFLSRERIDVLQIYYHDSTYFGVPVARLAGVPAIVRTRNNLGYWMTPVHRWLARGYNRFIDAMVANCEACRVAVAADEGLRPAAVEVVENGVDLARYRTVATPPSAHDRPPRVGLVANLRPVKDPETFVRAARLVADAIPSATFHLAGRGELRPDLEVLAARLDLADRVQFHGSVTDVPAFLMTLDVGVLCSRSEGMSNALLEYLAAGLPVVATAVGGNVHLIEPEVNGQLVAPGRADELAAAVVRLLRDPALAARLGAAGRRLVHARFSQQARAQRFQALYRRLCASSA